MKQDLHPVDPGKTSTRPRVLVIMDVDGTMLINGNALRIEFHRAFADITGVDISKLKINFAGSTDRYIVRQFIEQGGVEGDYEEIYGAVAKRFCELIAETYPTHPDPRLLPGVVDLLEELHKHPEVCLVLGTGNIRQSCDIKLARFGLEKYFLYGGGFGGDFEIRADAIREAIRIGAENCGWSPETGQAWVIGDTPNDAYAAHDAGANAILVATGTVRKDKLNDSGAEAVLPDLSNTQRVMELLGL